MAKAEFVYKVEDTVTPHNVRVLERTADRRVGDMLLHDIDISVDANFLKGGRDESGAEGVWPKRKRPRRGTRGERKGRLLYVTGALFKSTFAIHKAEYDGKGNWTANKGSNLPYAATHNYGDPDRNIEKREFLMVPEPELDTLAQKIGRFIFA